MPEVIVQIQKEETLERFLNLHGFEVEGLGDGLFRVVKGEELPVYLKISEESIYFEADLGNVSAFADKDFYFKLLDLNTEILPVSFGINNANPDDPRLVLLESRETSGLNDNELLKVFDALELAADKAEELLTASMK